MKEKLTKNIGLKILSVILAAILWLVITNVDDPVEAKGFTDIKVQVLNEKAITSLDKVYDITEGETIDFTVEARRSVRDRLKDSDFVVTADLTKLSITNSVPIEITCPAYGDEVTVIDGKNQFMMISLQQVITESYKVNIIQKGQTAQDYIVGEATASPNIIQVTGPKARVDRIAQVVAEVNVYGMQKSDELTAVPKALDADGNEIDTSNLTFSVEQVKVNIKIYKKKTIHLLITTKGEPAYGYVMTSKDYEPKEIIIAGEEDVLNRIMYLPITETITGATADIEKEINLVDLLEDGLIIVGEDKVVISIKIEKMVTKDLTIYPGDIEPRNKPDNLNLTFNSVGPIMIKVMGLQKDVDNLTPISVKPYIDLTDYSAGTYSLAFGIDKSNDVTLVDGPLISFNLTEKTD